MGILSDLLNTLFGIPPMSVAEANKSLASRAALNPEHLDWQNSIVDLMKLLGKDSSFSARQELARELGYPGDVNTDSAAMNVWLHNAVMAKVENRQV